MVVIVVEVVEVVLMQCCCCSGAGGGEGAGDAGIVHPLLIVRVIPQQGVHPHLLRDPEAAGERAQDQGGV